MACPVPAMSEAGRQQIIPPSQAVFSFHRGWGVSLMRVAPRVRTSRPPGDGRFLRWRDADLITAIQMPGADWSVRKVSDG